MKNLKLVFAFMLVLAGLGLVVCSQMLWGSVEEWSLLFIGLLGCVSMCLGCYALVRE